MPELVFEVVQESDGGYCAECLTESIFTAGGTWDELRQNVLEAPSAFYFDRPGPERVRLHLVRDESPVGGMKIPRDVSGVRLPDLPCRKWQNSKVHQVGSHIILETSEPTHHGIAIPDHHPLRLGTFHAIHRAVARHKAVDAILAGS